MASVTLDRKQVVRISAVAVGVALIGFLLWWILAPRELKGFASGNGRIEATEIDIAPKFAGRIEKIFANEGDFVHVNDVIAVMDVSSLLAERNEDVAKLKAAESDIATAQSVLAQRQSEKRAAQAVVLQREAELHDAQQRLKRSSTLSREGAMAVQEYDDDVAGKEGSAAAVASAKAQLAAADAAVVTARTQVASAIAEAAAARATVARVQADLNDNVLKSPRLGRVQYRVAQPGEVLSAGGRVLNLLDLTDVYMTFFLPTKYAGRIQLGAEARIVLDTMPQTAIPARVTFVADVAQFTPKTVETEEERQKLTFRIKARIDPEILRKYMRSVKTGLPGVAYVRLDPKAEWPANLGNVLK